MKSETYTIQKSAKTAKGIYTWWECSDGEYMFTWNNDIAHPDCFARDEKSAEEWFEGESTLGAYHRLLPAYQYLREHLNECYDLGIIDNPEINAVMEPLDNLLKRIAKEYGTDHGEEYWLERNAKEEMRRYLNETYEW